MVQIKQQSSEMFIIGICGGTASGKSTLSKMLLKYNPEVNIISHDSYYKDCSHLNESELKKYNFDHPDSIDNELFLTHLKSLVNGRSVNIPTYCFASHSRIMNNCMQHIQPSPVLIVEGSLIFSSNNLRNMFNLKIFIDVEDDIRLLRRISRDIEQRGRKLTDVLFQYHNTVKWMHDVYVGQNKRYADIILSDITNDNVNLLNVFINSILRANQ